MSDELAVNGRFLTQPTTGTQRYASELTLRLATRHPGRVVLHVPRGTQVPEALAGSVRVVESRASGQLFEQVALPWAARHRLLLSLGGPAPLLARRQVATLHDASVFRFPQTYGRAFRTWYRTMYRVLARRATHVLTVSQFSAAELRDVVGLDPARTTVVPNGSDHVDDLHPRAPRASDAAAGAPLVPEAGPWVVCVGTFARHKNLAPALDALEAAGIPSVVVGARGSRRVFAAADVGRWDRAVFAGRLDDAELAFLYRNATALVFPSRYEGFGIPVVEAQRLGCPVVALRAGPLPEVAGEGAVLCAPDDPAEVVAAVRRLWGDPAHRSRLVELGRANAARFTWDASADRLEAVLRDLGWQP